MLIGPPPKFHGETAVTIAADVIEAAAAGLLAERGQG
jgi:hypothetical protein